MHIPAGSMALILIASVSWGQPQMAQIDWTGVYTAQELPGDAGWGGGGGENTSAEVTEQGLHLVDAGTANGELRSYSRNWGARPDRGALVQATVKVVSCASRAGVCLLAADGVHEEAITLYPDRLECGGSGLVYPMDTTDDFHTYQLRISGMNFEVWVDGKPVIDGWGLLTAPAHQHRNVVVFGSISSAATSEAYFKEVRTSTGPLPKRLEGAEDVVIYHKPGVYACFPSLTRLDDGRLVTSFGTRVRRSHIDGTGGGARMISADGGRTWQPTDETFTPPQNLREDGTVLIPGARGWIYVDEAELPQIKERGRHWLKAKEGTVAYLGDPQVTVVKPDGTREVIELPCPVKGGMMTFNSSSFVRENDLWLCVIYGADGPEALSGVWAVRSEDNGETWEVLPVALPMGDDLGFNETAICQNGMGELIVVMRPTPENHNSYQCFSNDGGKTWSKPEDCGFWGYPSNLIRLRDGRLLCTYGYRRDGMGVRAVLSSDGGHTWDTANEIILRADGTGNGGDNGYPLSVQLEDGTIFTIYYLNDNQNVTHIAGTHWTVPAPAQ